MPLQNVFMAKHLRATPGEIGLIFSLSSALTGLGQLTAPFLAKRWGKVRAVTVSQLLSLPFLAAMGFVPSLGVYAVASLVRTGPATGRDRAEDEPTEQTWPERVRCDGPSASDLVPDQRMGQAVGAAAGARHFV